MRRVIRVVVTLCIALLITVPAQAGDVVAEKADGLNIISISGDIVKGDAAKFNRVAASINGRATVYLNSNGGSALQGVLIGQAIRSKGYSTAVVNDTVCASACGLIWLAGTTRYVGKSAKIGFHAAYTGSEDDAKESGAANALIGAYLTKLGLSFKAIIFVTLAPPDEISWLHPDDAKQAGIQYTTFPDATQPRLNNAPAALQDFPTGGIPYLACMALTASVYHLPPRVLPAIQAVAGGRVGQVHLNKDESEDLGVMQINTLWVSPLARFTSLPDLTVRDRLLNDPCFNIAAAGLILRTYLNETKGDLLRAVGYFHSRAPVASLDYQTKVLDTARKMFSTRP